MFNFFRRSKSAGKPSSSQDGEPATSETIPSDGDQNKHKNIGPRNITAVSPASERANTLTRKDVVNLLIPETDYSQQRAPSGPVATLLNKMAGHKRRGKRNNRNHWRNPQKKDNNTNEMIHENIRPYDNNKTHQTIICQSHVDNPVIPRNLSDDDFGIYETVQVREFTHENDRYKMDQLKNRRSSDGNLQSINNLDIENVYDEEVLDSDSGIFGSVTVKDYTSHKPEKLIEDLINLRKEVINGTSVETNENAAVQNENTHESDFETCTHERDEDAKYIPANTLPNKNINVVDESADFVRDLVLAKYARSPTTTHASKRTPHISLVYVSHDPANEQNTTNFTKDSTQLSNPHHNFFCAPEHFENSRIRHDDETSFTPTVDPAERENILNNDNVTEINISDTGNTAFFEEISIEENYPLKKEGHVDTEEACPGIHVDKPAIRDTDHTDLLDKEITSALDNLKNDLLMGVSDSKNSEFGSRNDSIDEGSKSDENTPQIQVSNDENTESTHQKDDRFESLKQGLTEQLEKIYKEQTIDDDSPENWIKKSNLKPPRSDTEGCSDDDRSEGGGKKVTFKKIIQFDDGDTQTDDEKDSSFESFESTSEEESESEEESDTLGEPDNDEMLGGVVVARKETKNVTDETPGDVQDDTSCLPATLESFDDCEDFDREDECRSVSKDADEKTQEYSSDSGFVDTSMMSESKENTKSEVRSSEIESDSESEEEVTASEEEESELGQEDIEEEEEETSSEEDILEESVKPKNPSDTEEVLKNLVSQESRFASQVSRLSDAAAARAADADELRALVSGAAKQIEAKDADIERLKDELQRAYKESELIRQRLRSLEDELLAARSCCADLAKKLDVIDESNQTNLKEEIHRAARRCTELERRVQELEQNKAELEQERDAQTRKAEEVVALAAAGEARWRRAHEAARTQASERAERVLDDCEWKMRELEKRARDADKKVAELTVSLQKAEQDKNANPAQVGELSRLRGLNNEQQRSIAALTTQCAAADSRERALQLEVARLKDLLEKGRIQAEEVEKKHKEELSCQILSHSKALLEQKSRHTREREHCARAESERLRAHAERTRSALAQLRDQHKEEQREVNDKLEDAQARLESLQEEVTRKEEEYSSCAAEARSKADWELLQLRHLLDRADVRYANAVEAANDKHEKEIERLNCDWSSRLCACTESASSAAAAARVELDRTRANMDRDRLDQLHKLNEEHKRDMERQWEKFMSDKEECLSRMKIECHEEGEETRARGEKELMDEISELKAEIASCGGDFAILEQKAANCSRTLEVTEQELREALEREKKLRCLRSEDADKYRLAQKNSQEAVEHLTRKCACLRKLFDDMRNRMEMREQLATEAQQAKQREIETLRAEVARLTKAIMLNRTLPKALGARTQADGCDELEHQEISSELDSEKKQPSFLCQAGRVASKTSNSAPRGKGGGHLENNNNPLRTETGDRHRRSKSVDLPAVQVPSRIKQLEGKKSK